MSTRAQLAGAAVAVLREQGIGGVSARAIAAAAGVNQALVFYHYGGVEDLLDQACRAAADEAVAAYRDELAEVTTLVGLLELGRGLHERETLSGNVAVMAQLMAAAQRSDTLRGTAAYCLQLWVDQISTVVDRALAGSPLRDIVDVAGLARAISASFIGLELYDGVDPAGAQAALGTLDALGALVEVVDGMGRPAAALLRARLRSVRRHDT
jgi:AcrR family transcriptional regulator